ncbi:DMT family transporter [Kitasatospora atroaurantiaca]
MAVVLVAAVTHASWNAVAHSLKDELAGLCLVGVGRTACGLGLACLAPVPAAAAWPYLLLSVGLHVGYQILLMRSFRLGDFGQVYPIARGTAPLVVTLVAAVFVGERLHGSSAFGVAVASVGLVGLALWGLRSRRGPGAGAGPGVAPAVAAAVATGLAIAAYTVVDGLGVRSSAAVLGYIAWLMVLDGAAVPLYAVLTHGRGLAERLRPVTARGLLGGVMSVLSYGLVLWAQAHAPLAPVAVLRESSIIVGAGIGAVFFKERFGGARMAAAGVMLAGIALILWQ